MLWEMWWPKALAKRRNMFPETFAAETCFFNVSQCFYIVNTVSSTEYVSAVKQKLILLLEIVFPVWQN